MNSIFSVDAVRYNSYGDERRYLEREVYVNNYGYAESLKEAEKIMHQVIKNWNYDLFCFYIREDPINRLRIKHYQDIQGELSEHVYDAEGHLLDSRGHVKEFNGRAPETIRFKHGDIVEVYNGYKKSYLGYVMEVPLSIDDVKTNKLSGLLDYSDDQYMIKTDDTFDHDHVNSLYVFKPHFKVPTPIIERFKNNYKSYLRDYVNKWFDNPPTAGQLDWMRKHEMNPDGTFNI